MAIVNFEALINRYKSEERKSGDLLLLLLLFRLSPAISFSRHLLLLHGTKKGHTLVHTKPVSCYKEKRKTRKEEAEEIKTSTRDRRPKPRGACSLVFFRPLLSRPPLPHPRRRAPRRPAISPSRSPEACASPAARARPASRRRRCCCFRCWPLTSPTRDFPSPR